MGYRSLVVLPLPAFAGYSVSGTVSSANILSGSSASSITGFYYNLALLPGDSSITAQFSTDNSTWYSAAGVLDGSTTLSTVGGATVDLTALGWSGAFFYYKLTLNATSDLTGSPVIESVRLDYVPTTGYNGAFVVNSTGTVGIGTSNSAYKLDVAGDVNLASGYAVLINGSRVLKGNTTDGTVYLGGIDSSITTAYLRTAGVDRMTIDGSGRVGVATSSPSSRLSISAASTGLGGLYIAGAANGTANLFNISTSTASAARTAFIIDQNGKTGIGTSTPWAVLSVSGNVSFSSLRGTFGAGSLCLTAGGEVVYNSGSDACTSSLRSTKHDIKALGLSGLWAVGSLQPVTFVYNEGDGRTRYGFIAEDAAFVDDHLATHDAGGNLSGIDDRAISAMLVQSVKELSSILQIATSTSASTTAALASVRLDSIESRIAALESKSGPVASAFAAISEWAGQKITAAVAYLDNIFANKITTKELCVDDVCVTREQFKTMVGQSGAASTQNTSDTEGVEGGNVDAVSTTTLPVITLLGNNPSEIFVGTSFVDPGATAVDGNGNALMPDIATSTVDTAVAGNYEVVWVAHDSAMNWASSTRTVIVNAPALSFSVASSSEQVSDSATSTLPEGNSAMAATTTDSVE